MSQKIIIIIDQQILRNIHHVKERNHTNKKLKKINFPSKIPGGICGTDKRRYIP